MGIRLLVLVAAVLAAAFVAADDARRAPAQEGSPKEVEIKIGGEPGTEFSGRCAVGGEKDELDGRVPQQISYRFVGEKFECEVRQRSAGALEVVFESDNDRSEQRVNSRGSKIKFTYSEDAISSSTSSSGSSSSSSVVNQTSSSSSVVSQTSSSSSSASSSQVQVVVD